MTRGRFLQLLWIMPLTYLSWKHGWTELQKDNRLYFTRGKQTFVVWPDGDGPLTDKERDRARQMAQEYFNTL